MKLSNLYLAASLCLTSVALVPAQTATTQNTAPQTAAAPAKPKRPPVFRATKDQVTQAQTMMKERGLYEGTATGKLDQPTRDALKKFQTAESLKPTGTLNRLTLEKMKIELTARQSAM